MKTNNNKQTVSRNDEPLLKKMLVCCFCETYSQREFVIEPKRFKVCNSDIFVILKIKCRCFKKSQPDLTIFILLLFNFVVFDISSLFFLYLFRIEFHMVRIKFLPQAYIRVLT